MITVEAIVCFLAAVLTLGLTAEPIVNCPVPVSPQNGQIKLLASGGVVQFACDPGYILIGARFLSCIDGKWIPDPPECKSMKARPTVPEVKVEGAATTVRPLFKWDDDLKENSTSTNKTEEDMQADEAMVRMLLYPERRIVTRVQRIRSGSEIEDEEQKRLKKAPSVIYVRNPVRTVVEDDGNVQVVSVPEKGVQSDDALRYLYYMAHYADPRYAETVLRSGYPYGMSLSESQVAWINSLHPEVRDKYLKDLYSIGGVDSRVRTHALLRNYADRSHWYYYNNPYYYASQPLASLVEDPVSKYDYSCYQTEDDGRVTRVRAPRLRHAYIHRYDRRQSPNHPHNNYLVAEYRCSAGYTLLDHRVNELYCSQRRWIGTSPTCVLQV